MEATFPKLSRKARLRRVVARDPRYIHRSFQPISLRNAASAASRSISPTPFVFGQGLADIEGLPAQIEGEAELCDLAGGGLRDIGGAGHWPSPFNLARGPMLLDLAR
jgi:hypothetical protein